MDYSVRARIRFYSTLEGGREGPILRKSFGCILQAGEALLECRIDLTETAPVSPGDEVEVDIRFLSPELASRTLGAIRSFKLREAREIAEGTVLSTSGGV